MITHEQERRYQLRIELDDLLPKVWREVIVPESISLAWLHEVIQEAMLGWMDMHSHRFEHKKKVYGQLDEEEESGFEELVEEGTVPLNRLLRKIGDQLTYIYDPRDRWKHTVRLEKILPAEAAFLQCLGGERACPPEDCYGTSGYEELLDLAEENAKGKLLSEDKKEHLDWFELVRDEDNFTEEDRSEVNETFQDMIEHASEGGGMAVGGASPYADDGIFKAHEIDDWDEDDDADIAEMLGSLAQPDPQSEPSGFWETADEPEVASEPYSELSAGEQRIFKKALGIAQQVRACEPWKTMYDSDIFGIELPETGELALVSILGANKEVFSLQIHRPPHGFKFWKQALGHSDGLTQDWILHNASIIEVEFLNKSELEDPDLALYDLVGAEKPRKGPKKWGIFRSYRPHAFPWFPRADDLPLLIQGMRLLTRYFELMRQSPIPKSFTLEEIRSSGLPDTIKTFQLNRGADAENLDEWELSDVPVNWESCGETEAPFLPSEFEVHQLAVLARSKTHWELGAIYFPSPVMTKVGPVLPIVALAVDPSEESVPMPHMNSDLEASATQVVWECLKERALQQGALPQEIHVATEAAQKTLEELQHVSGVRVVRRDKLDFLSSLFASLSQSPPTP